MMSVNAPPAHSGTRATTERTPSRVCASGGEGSDVGEGSGVGEGSEGGEGEGEGKGEGGKGGEGACRTDACVSRNWSRNSKRPR